MHKLTQGNNAALSALSVVVNAQADARSAESELTDSYRAFLDTGRKQHRPPQQSVSLTDRGLLENHRQCLLSAKV